MKPKKILLLALFSGIITTILFYSFINNEVSQTNTEPIVEMTQVIVAVEDIPGDKQITEELVSSKEIPEDQVHPEMIKDVSVAINHYTSTDIKQGEILMNHRMQQKEEEKKVVSRKINEGNRAVSIDVTYVTGVSNLIQPEDYVDVVWSEGLETGVILEKVRVLAVGQRMTEVDSEGTEVLYQAVTLELEQDDTVTIINANGRGELQLTLYSRSDLIEEAENETTKKDAETAGEKETVTPSEIITVPENSVIRKSPNLSASPIEVVTKETSLVLLDKQEKDEDGRIWLQVETAGQEKGWISSRIVRNKEE
ncbi:Flp pilus assembly protein CpaB [Virgibacillus sp. C22-A2]|uniref:Flp pilus assembly protein CpaB n=1 Tax=Virgibacillus tibetensis TaxID=3042313 RepID=A0ABU6KCW6_9BACI|nr:Flp pilus assembly protein CpaB [Virgibacillus sp. C22-A2]